MQIKRRSFLGGGLAGVGCALVGVPLRARGAEAEAAATFDPFERVPLGKTGIQVSRVGIGTGVKGGNRQSNHTRMGKDKLQALLRGSYERGVRLFDMADLYGTHPYLLPALDGVPREDYAIVSKMWVLKGGLPEPERPAAEVVVERFLRELKTPYLDLVLLHCMTESDWPTKMADQMGRLAGLKRKGLIRAHGVSCHSLPALRAAAKEPWVDSVHARINPFGVKMDGPADQVVPVLQELHAAGKGVVGMKILGEGEFRNDSDKINQSLQFVLRLGCVDTIVVGFEKLEELDDLTKRVRATTRA